MLPVSPTAEMLLETCEQGDVFGDEAMIAKIPRPCRATVGWAMGTGCNAWATGKKGAARDRAGMSGDGHRVLCDGGAGVGVGRLGGHIRKGTERIVMPCDGLVVSASWSLGSLDCQP